MERSDLEQLTAYELWQRQKFIEEDNVLNQEFEDWDERHPE